jgi:hypothetical protein
MTLRRTAFCRGGVKGFLRSQVKARGCTEVGVFVGGQGGTGGNTLWSLDPTDGSQIWAANPATPINKIVISPSGRLYVTSSGTHLYEIDRSDGSVINTRSANVAIPFDVFPDGDLAIYDNGEIVRCDANLTNDEYNEAVANGIDSMAIASDGNIYTTSRTSPYVRKLDGTDGTSLATDTDPTLPGVYGIIAPPGSYTYHAQLWNNAGTLRSEISERNKSDCDENATYIWKDSGAADGFNTGNQNNDFDSTHLYFANADVDGDPSVRKIAISGLSLAASYDTGQDAFGCMLANDLLISVGQRSTTWAGNDGTNRSCWALNKSDMSLNWSFDSGGNLQSVATEYRVRT